MGHWQKSIPEKTGLYHTADRQGNYAGIKNVVYDRFGNLVFAGMPMYSADDGWQAWWWSERITEPTPPPPEAWDNHDVYAFDASQDLDG